MQREYSYSDIESAANAIENAYNTTLAWLDKLETNYPEAFEQMDEETKAEVFAYVNQIKTTLSEAHDKINLSDKLAQLKNLYKLYQAKSSEPTMTARELVNFLLSHKDDSRLSGALTPSAISQLQLVQFIMNNQTTPYSAGALAQTFGLDAEKLLASREVHVEADPLGQALGQHALYNLLDVWPQRHQIGILIIVAA